MIALFFNALGRRAILSAAAYLLAHSFGVAAQTDLDTETLAAILQLLRSNAHVEEACPFSLTSTQATRTFTYASILDRAIPNTLSASVQDLNARTGQVVVNGVDTSAPAQGFTVDWGDGEVDSGVFFPMRHRYAVPSGSYAISVRRFGDDAVNGVNFFALFDPAATNRVIDVDDRYAVSIPREVPAFNAWFPVPDLDVIDSSVFQNLGLADAEYILSMVSMLALEAVGCAVELFDGGLEQVFLFDEKTPGAYAAWFAQPATVGVGPGLTQPFRFWSSYIHEISHNVTLNYPMGFRYGGKIDGPANAIWSETIAQIFQHSIGYELVNRAAEIGVPREIAVEIEADLLNTYAFLRQSHDRYVEQGLPFLTWNDPSSPSPEVLLTFSTLAYKYVQYVEERGGDHMGYLKDYMCALSVFDSDVQRGFDQWNDSLAGAVFRSTLMLAAIRYVFGSDALLDMRALGFPVDDAVLDLLLSKFRSRCGAK